MKTTTMKKLTALTATAMLGLGLAACSPANENPASSEAVESADAKASEEQQAREDGADVTETNVTTGTVTETATADGKSGAAAAPVATTTITDANGNDVEVPEAIADKYEALGGADSKLGHVNAVEDFGEGRWLATFERDGYNHYLAYTPETGAVLIHGEIAKQWLNAGGFDSAVAAPTDEETALTDGSGWEQSFENGSISWTKDATGEFQGAIENK